MLLKELGSSGLTNSVQPKLDPAKGNWLAPASVEIEVRNCESTSASLSSPLVSNKARFARCFFTGAHCAHDARVPATLLA